MSAGVFAPRQKYETESGLILRIKVQPETALALLDPEGTGTLINVPSNDPFSDTSLYPSVKVSAGKREIGWHPRMIVGNWGETEGTDLPVGYKPFSEASLVVFTAANYAALADGQNITYLGNTLRNIRKIDEFVV